MRAELVTTPEEIAAELAAREERLMRSLQPWRAHKYSYVRVRVHGKRHVGNTLDVFGLGVGVVACQVKDEPGVWLVGFLPARLQAYVRQQGKAVAS